MLSALLLSEVLLLEIVQLTSAQDTGLLSSLSSECVTFVSSYPPTIYSYASQICHVCQGLNLSPSVEPCCRASNPTACFASSFYGVTVTDTAKSNPITVAPPSFTGSVNCDAVISILRRCEGSTPGFDALSFHDQQSCLCTTSGTWAPDYFDDYWSSCMDYASTASSDYFSLFGPEANGSVQRRKCGTWYSFTATGGTVSSTTQGSSTPTTTISRASAGNSIQPASSTGVAESVNRVQVC